MQNQTTKSEEEDRNDFLMKRKKAEKRERNDQEFAHCEWEESSAAENERKEIKEKKMFKEIKKIRLRSVW